MRDKNLDWSLDTAKVQRKILKYNIAAGPVGRKHITPTIHIPPDELEEPTEKTVNWDQFLQDQSTIDKNDENDVK